MGIKIQTGRNITNRNTKPPVQFFNYLIDLHYGSKQLKAFFLGKSNLSFGLRTKMHYPLLLLINDKPYRHNMFSDKNTKIFSTKVWYTEQSWVKYIL